MYFFFKELTHCIKKQKQEAASTQIKSQTQPKEPIKHFEQLRNPLSDEELRAPSNSSTRALRSWTCLSVDTTRAPTNKQTKTTTAAPRRKSGPLYTHSPPTRVGVSPAPQWDWRRRRWAFPVSSGLAGALRERIFFKKTKI